MEQYQYQYQSSLGEAERRKSDRCSYEELQKENLVLETKVEYLENIGQLAAGIAHEIRNPLTTIKGFIQLIQPYLREIGKEEYALISLEEISRADTILYQFLNAAKPKEKRREMIQINKLIEDMAILYEGEANLQGITIRTLLCADNPSILIDDSQLKQVLVNLIKNSFEAIQCTRQKNGRISIGTSNDCQTVKIRITDNGIGMSDDCLKSLFNPFYTTKNSGTGLGLTICDNIIRSFGGHIDISSKIGKGTTFTIVLPMQDEYKLNA